MTMTVMKSLAALAVATAVFAVTPAMAQEPGDGIDAKDAREATEQREAEERAAAEQREYEVREARMSPQQLETARQLVWNGVKWVAATVMEEVISQKVEEALENEEDPPSVYDVYSEENAIRDTGVLDGPIDPEVIGRTAAPPKERPLENPNKDQPNITPVD